MVGDGARLRARDEEPEGELAGPALVQQQLTELVLLHGAEHHKHDGQHLVGGGGVL